MCCALKICFPDTFQMIRGNHECRLLTSYFTFEKECMKKYKSKELYEEIMMLFDAFPLAALIEDKTSRFICVHGGLSPEINSISDIESLDRFCEPGKTGALCDLLWSDPLEEDTSFGLKEEEMKEWYDVRFVENPTRGCGFVFGFASTIEFLEHNQLTAIIRAHEVQRSGYGLNRFKQKGENCEPLVITVFSAPNYCDFYGNKGALLKIKPAENKIATEIATENKIATTQLEFAQFEAVPHPFWLPKLKDGIEYTWPFLIQKTNEILQYLTSQDDLDQETEEETLFYKNIQDSLLTHKIKSSPPSLLSTTPRVAHHHHDTLLSPRTSKNFLTIQDRIELLNEDVSNRDKIVKRLSDIRGGLIDQKIFQNKMRTYLAKATTKFQKAKQTDLQNECIPT